MLTASHTIFRSSVLSKSVLIPDNTNDVRSDEYKGPHCGTLDAWWQFRPTYEKNCYPTVLQRCWIALKDLKFLQWPRTSGKWKDLSRLRGTFWEFRKSADVSASTILIFCADLLLTSISKCLRTLNIMFLMGLTQDRGVVVETKPSRSIPVTWNYIWVHKLMRRPDSVIATISSVLRSGYK